MNSPFFSTITHLLSPAHLEQMKEFMATYEAIVHIPKFRQEIIDRPFTEKGIFNSYDFHITADGPRLIEINTNAAGAILSLRAAHSLYNSSPEITKHIPPPEDLFDEEKIITMFEAEFRERFPKRILKTIAIIDESPLQQFFYPEFVALKELLTSRGFEVFIADPQALEIRRDEVYLNNQRIDFIYNRLTDFYFEKPSSSAIKKIYENGLAVVSPNPTVHALYARKSNLALLWSDEWVKKVQLSSPLVEKMRMYIPETHIITENNSDYFWQHRKEWFFKPTHGFGSKGSYRGEKITTKVWHEIQQNHYIAQKYIPPDKRPINTETSMKYDVRLYTYGSSILGIVVRYYEGQTTNFRTPQGGLAIVLMS